MCVQKVAGASSDRWGSGAPTGQIGPSRSRGNVFVLVSHSHDKTNRLCVGTKRCPTLAEDIILEWEQRKKRRVGGGAPCESRKTCVILEVYVVRDSTHDQASLQLYEFRNKLTAAGASGAPDRPDLPHAVAVALWPAPLVNLTNLARHTLFTSVNLGMWLVTCIRDVLRQVVM